MKYIITISTILLFAVLGNAQADTAHIYTYGGEFDEQGRDIIQTSDGGFLILGGTSSFGSGISDVYLLKIASDFSFQWSKAIGEYNLDFGQAVVQTTDGGFAIAGYSNSSGNGSYDGYLVRTDSNGTLIWQEFFGGLGWDKFYDLVATSDGGFVIVGETYSSGSGASDGWVIRTDSNGGVVYEQTYGGSRSEAIYSVISTKDGNHAFCGTNESLIPENNGDAWICKIDSAGGIIFENTYDRYQLPETFYSMIQDSQDRFVCVGKLQHEDEGQGINELVFRFRSNGDRDQDNHLLLSPLVDVATDIFESTNGNYVMSGYSNSFGNGGNGKSYGIRTIQLDANIQYVTDYTLGEGEFDQYGYKSLFLGDSWVVTGSHRGSTNLYTDVGVVLYDTDTVNKTFAITGPFNTEDVNSGVISTVNQMDASNQLSIHPNPSSGRFHIDTKNELSSISIINSNGQTIYKNLTDTRTIELEEIPEGIYTVLVRITKDQSISTHRLIISK